MEFRTYGKPDNPTLLLIPGEGMMENELYTPLKKLEGSYCLLLPAFAPAETPERRLEGMEACIRDHFAGRIWGAYGLDEGATLLLALLARGRVQIRTAVVDGTMALPPESLDNCTSSIVYWYGSRDKAAGKLLKTFRNAYPDLQTLRLKKLRTGERFLAIRPDQMVKRLRRTFGTGKLVNCTVLLPVDTDVLWDHLTCRDHAAAEQMKPPFTVTCREEERRLLIEGRNTLSRHWSHLLQLERLDDNLTLCTHQLELAGGALSSLSAMRARALLKKEHKVWKKQLNPSPRWFFPWLR